MVEKYSEFEKVVENILNNEKLNISKDKEIYFYFDEAIPYTLDGEIETFKEKCIKLIEVYSKKSKERELFLSIHLHEMDGAIMTLKVMMVSDDSDGKKEEILRMLNNEGIVSGILKNISGKRKEYDSYDNRGVKSVTFLFDCFAGEKRKTEPLKHDIILMTKSKKNSNFIMTFLNSKHIHGVVVYDKDEAMEIIEFYKSQKQHFLCIALSDGNAIAAAIGKERLFARELNSVNNNRVLLKNIVNLNKILANIYDVPINKRESIKERGHFTDTDEGVLKIVVVEDNLINYKIVEYNLIKMGFTPIHLDRAERALDVLQNNRVLAILLDINLPDKSGFTLAKEIKESGITNIPIIAMTANITEGEEEKYFSSGFSDFLKKPLKLKDIYVALNRNIKELPLKIDFSSNKLEEDDEFNKKIMDIFFKEVPEFIKRLRNSINKGDLESVVKEAHYLKSSFGNIKANNGFELLEQMELLARKRETSVLNNQLNLVEEEYNKIAKDWKKGE